jgi:peptidoglycan/LPS O-acetylase OafA/YrhL
MLGVAWTIALLFVTAFASYYCMERPLIRLGRRCFASTAAPPPERMGEECRRPLKTAPALFEQTSSG